MILRRTNSRLDDIITEGDNGTAGKHWAAGSLVTAPSVRKVASNALTLNQRSIADREAARLAGRRLAYAKKKAAA